MKYFRRDTDIIPKLADIEGYADIIPKCADISRKRTDISQNHADIIPKLTDIWHTKGTSHRT
jgi:hypothetical protein